MIGELLHFDPITLVVLLAGIIGGWYTLKNNSAWHGKWIAEHDKECRERERNISSILSEISICNSRLTTLAEAHEVRLLRIERMQDLHDN